MGDRCGFVLGPRIPTALASPIAGLVLLVFYCYDVERMTSYSGGKPQLSIHTTNNKIGNLEPKYIVEVLKSGFRSTTTKKAQFNINVTTNFVMM